MTFENLGLIEPLLRALQTEGYETPTPIQSQSIPLILQRKDLLGCAQTGTGKTAAFALPILQLLHQQRTGLPTSGRRPIKSLVLTPTRELALQISESFDTYGKHTGLRNVVIFGGVSQRAQTDGLRSGTDIVIATPGRLLDLMQQGYVNLNDLEVLVLDEADRMLDMGFIHDVKKILAKLPARKQTLFFSATMAPEIMALSSTILVNPEKVAVTPVSSTAETVKQSIFFVEKQDKKSLLVHLLKNSAITSALVFTRTKHGANRLAKDLWQAGLGAEAIHGNKSQAARQRALYLFKNGKLRVLVATDIAARGIDIEDLSHVVNYELPNIPETYVHRIGRTGRAGASGIALSFCDSSEREFLFDIQKLLGKKVPEAGDHPFRSEKFQPVELPLPRGERFVSRAGAGQKNGFQERRPNPVQRPVVPHMKAINPSAKLYSEAGASDYFSAKPAAKSSMDNPETWQSGQRKRSPWWDRKRDRKNTGQSEMAQQR